MGIFLLAELTTIGSLFSDFVGDRGYPIIIVVAVITSVSLNPHPRVWINNRCILLACSAESTSH